MKNYVAMQYIMILLLGTAVRVQSGEVHYNGTKRDKSARAGIRNGTDVNTFLDVNRLKMYVSNVGLFASDPSWAGYGLEFPNGSGKSVIFSAGLWLAGEVNGELRVAIADYATEYAPGIMVNGAAAADDSTIRVYRINRGDGAGNADYRDWPRAHGAPVNENGEPFIIGDEMTWTVFNDADSSRHHHIGGGTSPLGIEVRQTAFAFDRSSALGHTIFMKYILANRGENEISNTYMSFWCDSDLGGASDDLVGCDVDLGLGYCYNATNDDYAYGDKSPAIGFLLLEGPKDDSGKPQALSVFNKYVGGSDPATPRDSYNYMKGTRWDGTAWRNPFTNEETAFFAPGDPVSGSGWLDEIPADRRFMLSCGPFTFAPGDSAEVWLAVIAAQGDDRLSSIRKLNAYSRIARYVFENDFRFENTPPAALFDYIPESGGMPFPMTCDPSGSEDEEDENSMLRVRWDWNDDGQWDTDFAAVDTVRHVFPTPGMYPVTMEAMDAGGLKSIERRYIRVNAPRGIWIELPFPPDSAQISIPCSETTISLSITSGNSPGGELLFMSLGTDGSGELDGERVFQRAAGYYRIVAPRATSGSAVLSLTYADSTLEKAGIEEENLALAYLDSITGEWNLLPTVISRDINKVTAEATHFSLWGLVDRTSASISAVEDENKDSGTIKNYRLYQNYPNPFNPTTTILYEINLPSEVELRIYSISGRCIRTLERALLEPGQYSAVWDGKNDANLPVPSGIYICELRAGGFAARKKMVLLR